MGQGKVDDLPMLGNFGVNQIQTGTQSLWGQISPTPSANRLPAVLPNTNRRQFARFLGDRMARTRGRRDMRSL